MRITNGKPATTLLRDEQLRKIARMMNDWKEIKFPSTFVLACARKTDDLAISRGQWERDKIFYIFNILKNFLHKNCIYRYIQVHVHETRSGKRNILQLIRCFSIRVLIISCGDCTTSSTRHSPDAVLKRFLSSGYTCPLARKIV